MIIKKKTRGPTVRWSIDYDKLNYSKDNKDSVKIVPAILQILNKNSKRIKVKTTFDTKFNMWRVTVHLK